MTWPCWSEEFGERDYPRFTERLRECLSALGQLLEQRACWAVHSPVGCGVSPRMRMRRVDHGQDVGLGAIQQAGDEESRARIASA
jgi:hypothetical protein